ncbi:hypothetical protein BFG60_0219 [Microcystis aeruginosa NIES-98]|nr:hypothetical protein BFG60_0219 [Microcystis aeruginosa NIES-98]
MRLPYPSSGFTLPKLNKDCLLFFIFTAPIFILAAYPK